MNAKKNPPPLSILVCSQFNLRANSEVGPGRDKVLPSWSQFRAVTNASSSLSEGSGEGATADCVCAEMAEDNTSAEEIVRAKAITKRRRTIRPPTQAN